AGRFGRQPPGDGAHGPRLDALQGRAGQLRQAALVAGDAGVFEAERVAGHRRVSARLGESGWNVAGPGCPGPPWVLQAGRARSGGDERAVDVDLLDAGALRR